MIATARPWPMPAHGDPDFIIHDPAMLDYLLQRSRATGPATSVATGILTDHCTAVAAMIDLHEVLARYTAGRP